ncbi:28039_t:CDS:1, partial [Dentiscutata erythropus]
MVDLEPFIVLIGYRAPLHMVSNEFKRTGRTRVALKSGISSERLEE